MRDVSRLLTALCLAVAIGAAAPPAAAGPHVVGGNRTSTIHFPFAVFLITDTGFQFCGGTLLAARKVITAAHCVVDRAPERLRVVAGRDDKESRAGVVTGVTAIWVHPGYTDVQAGDDIAVLTLDSRLHYRTARLPDPADAWRYRADSYGTVLGWGRTAEHGHPSRYLLAAGVPVVADAECAEMYEKFTPASMVCAGYPQGGVDTCKGDSGGPLLVGRTLIGIASWGDGCAQAGKPGVYTRVSEYAALVAAQL
ncbi:MAG TPA: serine protease [Actinophytocola sp.]|uniref:S1 family peptidase n=1 Tax=Actinophytocola sp. TaxID=1872138 RepID=UPI002DB9A9DB|nr:serine protease [Actinophytocola sp.]HEU5470492.1 serine protease [Actinophytocola sp.]